LTDKKLFVSLRTRFVLALIMAVVLCLVCAGVTRLIGWWGIDTFYMSEENSRARCSQILDDFEDFVQQRELDSGRVRDITIWAKQRGHLYIQVSTEEQILVDSGWLDEEENLEDISDGKGRWLAEDEVPALHLAPALPKDETELSDYYSESYYMGIGNRPVAFSDGICLVTIYDWSDTPLYEAVTATSLVVMLVTLFGIMVLYHNSVIRRIIGLSGEVERIAEGGLNETITVRKGDEIGQLAEHVDQMRFSIIKEMRAEQEAWNANRDLITRMSHDIRTPLTVLLGFLELLEEGDFSQDEAYRDYMGICKKNAFQMKALADKLFQYFLVFANDGSVLNLELANVTVLLRQLAGEHILLLQEKGWNFQYDLPEDCGYMMADTVHMKRLFDNLLSNVEKYADKDHPVVIQIQKQDRTLRMEVSNVIRRNEQQVESTNMGVKTCQRIVELMNGSYDWRVENGRYIVQIALPLCSPESGKN